MTKIIFNHSYTLKHDSKRTYIIASDDESHNNVIKGWMSRVHPIYAMILSLLAEPCTKEQAVERISFFLDISKDEANSILTLFLNAKEPFITKYNGIPCPFPTGLIISIDEERAPRRTYYPQQFLYKDVDVKRERCYVSPVGLVYMVNNTCATSCIYCYADKQTRCSPMSLNEIERMCANAQRLGITDLGITGGEVFMHNDWHSLLKLLCKYGFKPSLISTKKALCEQDLVKLKELGIKMQVSLDSLNEGEISKLLGVGKGYLKDITNTIRMMEALQMDFQIATVLTNFNDSISNLEALYGFLSPLKHLSRWEVRIAFRSLYSRQDFSRFKISADRKQALEKWIENKQANSEINILWSPDTGKLYHTAKEGSKSFSGNRCSANYSHMVVLPDGLVTICEQLYWNPRFIIGDIKKQSIEEIWNSPRALELANLPRTKIRKESPCSSCRLYDNCLHFPNKCYADVLKSYGEDNWDYPDPRCIYAPQFVYEME